jgi:hypothetical protein
MIQISAPRWIESTRKRNYYFEGGGGGGTVGEHVMVGVALNKY